MKVMNDDARILYPDAKDLPMLLWYDYNNMFTAEKYTLQNKNEWTKNQHTDEIFHKTNI